MSSNLTYNALVAQIGAYLEKAARPGSSAYAQIPNIVALAQRAIVSELKLQGYEATLRGQMQAGVSIYAKPDRWRHTISMLIQIGSVTKLLFPRGYEYCRVYWPSDAVTGQPTFYADHGSAHWLIAATPDQAYNWETKVHLLPKLIGPQQQTNWLTDLAPNALLMRCLKEMSLFLKNPQDAQTFEAEYGKAISALATEDSKKLMDRAAERDGA